MSHSKKDAISQLVAKISKQKNIHGAVFNVESLDKNLSIIASAGNLSVESNYYLASINKLIISFITHRLCQNKQLHLSDKVSTFISKEDLNGILIYKEKDYSEELTITHLLSHTSGLTCYLIDKREDGKKNMDILLNGEDQSWSFEKVISEMKKRKLKFKPGQKGKANYSETNYRILDRVLEIVTQKSIQDLMTSTFEELGMKNTFVLNSENSNQCTPPYFKQNKIQLNDYWNSSNHDIASTAKDQMIFIRAFFEGNHLTKDTLSKIEQWNSIFFPFKYGIGIQKFSIPRFFSPFKAIPEMIGHCGSISSVAFYVPQKEIFITGTLNQASNPNVVFQTVIKIINKL